MKNAPQPDPTARYGRPPEGATFALAGFAAELELAAVPAEVVGRAKQVIADSLACAAGGYVLAPRIVDTARRYAETIGGTPVATLVGGGKMAQAVAAMANATMVHTIDYDDTHLPAIAHFGGPVTAAALAAAERHRATGEDLIAAVIGGFEAGGKVGRSALPGHYQRWHSTATLGGIAAAAAAARSARLDAAATDVAISFAADDAGGTRYCLKVGDYSKSLHAGIAAWKGSQGAVLAELGAEGPTGMLEHPVGFFWAYSDEGEPSRFLTAMDSLGSGWEIMEDDLKGFPTIHASHTPIESTIRLVSENDIPADQIAEIRIAHPEYSPNHAKNYEPDSEMAARLSIPYTVAVAALDREVNLGSFDDERHFDLALRELMRRVKSEGEKSLGERYPNTVMSITELETKDGEVYREELVDPIGSHRRPFTSDQHRQKLDELFSLSLESGPKDEILEVLGELDKLDDLNPLVNLLARIERRP